MPSFFVLPHYNDNSRYLCGCVKQRARNYAIKLTKEFAGNRASEEGAYLCDGFVKSFIAGYPSA